MGFQPSDAEDLTQGFFIQLLGGELFAKATPEKGRLRTFLLTAFQRFIRDVRDREQALKRGGAWKLIPIDIALAEESYARGTMKPATPEEYYERAWAHASVRAAFERLKKAEKDKGHEATFTELQPFLVEGSFHEPSYAEVAERLSRSEDWVKQAVRSLRKALRDHLRDLIAETLENPTKSQVEEELAALGAALR